MKVRLAPLNALCLVASMLAFFACGAAKNTSGLRAEVLPAKSALPKASPALVARGEVAPGIYVFELGTATGFNLRVFSNMPSLSSRRRLLMVDGSGCGSVIQKDSEGHLQTRLWGQVTAAFGETYQIFAVEKRGVALFSNADDGGETCSAEYQRYATIADRAADQEGALEALSTNLALPKPIAIGHSEGAVVAAFLGHSKNVAAIGVFAGLGPSQGFDFSLMFRKKMRGAADADVEGQIEKVMATIDSILREPERTDTFIWGHSYRRWASYITHPVSEALSTATVPVFVAHGSQDAAAQIESFDFLKIEMMRQRKTNIEFRRYAGLNHRFQECSVSEEDCSKKPQKFASVLNDFGTWAARK
jgi:pimeloyl-ACP methyl ester carboxylesterase